MAEDPKVRTPPLDQVRTIRRKYLQLGREIEALPGSAARDNLIHSKDKLGIFLSEAFGVASWRHADGRE